jgi:hypothetical protein
MLKRFFALFLVLACIVPLSACSNANEFELTFNFDENGKKEYIHYTDECIVYVVSGLMMCTVDGNPKMLEMALHDGDITVEAILDSAKKDAENGDMKFTEYPDGSVEYHYDGFNLVRLNAISGSKDIYFLPKSMGYNDVNN